MTNAIDIYVLGSVPGRATLDISDGGKTAHGGAVAVQKFLMRLFTVRGNDPVDPLRGTDFLANAYAGQLSSEPAATMYFTIAAKEAVSQLEAVETDDMPDDEKIYQVSLNSVTVDYDEVSIEATLTTRAGTAVEIDIPVPYGTT